MGTVYLVIRINFVFYLFFIIKMDNKYKSAIAEDLMNLRKRNSEGNKINIANYMDDVFMYILATFEVKDSVKKNLFWKPLVDRLNLIKNYIIVYFSSLKK